MGRKKPQKKAEGDEGAPQQQRQENAPVRTAPLPVAPPQQALQQARVSTLPVAPPQSTAWPTANAPVAQPQQVTQTTQPQGAVPKAGGSKNKYPKKVKETPAPASTAKPESTQGPQTSASALPEQMASCIISPTKSLVKIESSPKGDVYEGTRGARCLLEVNYLQIKTFSLIKTAYHYDVVFDPNASKKMWPIALDVFMRENFKGVHFAFDGRCNVYTNQRLKENGKVFDGTFEREAIAVRGDRSRTFKVKIKFATDVQLDILQKQNYVAPAFQHNDKPSQAIQCLDVVLRTAFKQLTARNQATTVGRALYFANSQRPLSLGEGMELWLGLFQSAILGRKSLYLNVDVAHKAFPSQLPVLNVLASFDRDNRIPAEIDQRTSEKLKAYLKMLDISYQPPNTPPKTFGFNDVVKPANEALFVKDDGTKMTVEQYFQREKGIRLRYPDLPCLHVGSRARNIYLPMEFCYIPAGQATNKKCTSNVVAAMIKYSATSTDERKRKITDLLNRIEYSSPGNDIAGFGIDVDKLFQKVEGRLIDPPRIQYQRGSVDPQRGVWDDRGQRFIQTQPIQIKWKIINCDNRTSIQQINELQQNISKRAGQQGMPLMQFKMDQDYAQFNMMRSQKSDLVNLLQQCKTMGYKLVFVVIIDQNDCYARFKQVAELEVGILTQCIKANTIYRMGKGNPMMTIGNILLKVNAKLGGFNHAVQETSYQKHNQPNSGIMFVGADVTHPGPDCRDLPSVVGVAASYDDVGFKYNCAWRLQRPTEEMIIDLANILVTQLQFYKAKNGKLPGKIMYYRDGVSDGQFTQVLDIELTGIRNALKSVYGQNPQSHPKVTFVVVQKRHHTRFFPTDRRFEDGKNRNVPAGTVVDKDIVHPFQYQFFLASHAAIQGVTKPAKYCVLVNESKISPDDLQAITYDLCHLFTRCNRSVSYPAPTYYAHLVAARGKNYTIGKRLDLNNLPNEYRRMVIQPEIVNNNPMFFV